MNLALVAQIDQAEASLRELLGAYPTYRNDVTVMNAVALVAVDTLAALNELGPASIDAKLTCIEARLHAWRRIAGQL
jgi:hypothetical protein